MSNLIENINERYLICEATCSNAKDKNKKELQCCLNSQQHTKILHCSQLCYISVMDSTENLTRIQKFNYYFGRRMSYQWPTTSGIELNQKLKMNTTTIYFELKDLETKVLFQEQLKNLLEGRQKNKINSVESNSNKCIICFELTPLILKPCGHSICEDCVNKMKSLDLLTKYFGGWKPNQCPGCSEEYLCAIV